MLCDGVLFLATLSGLNRLAWRGAKQGVGVAGDSRWSGLFCLTDDCTQCTVRTFIIALDGDITLQGSSPGRERASESEQLLLSRCCHVSILYLASSRNCF